MADAEEAHEHLSRRSSLGSQASHDVFDHIFDIYPSTNSTVPKEYPPKHNLTWRISNNGYSLPVIHFKKEGSMSGLTLNITVIKLHGPSLGKIHPFVEIKIGNEKRKTSTNKGTSDPANPHLYWVWEETLKFPLVGNEDFVRIQVQSKGMVSNNLVGMARIDISMLKSIYSQNTEELVSWFEIGRDKNQSVSSGALLLKFSFVNESGSGSVNDAFLSTPIRDRNSFSISSNGTPPLSTQTNSLHNSNSMNNLNNTSPSPLPSISSTATAAGLSIPLFKIGHSHTHSMDAKSKTLPADFSSQRASLSNKQMLFGGPLSNGLNRSKSSVPVIVFACIEYLTKNGLKTEGLFRVSGQHSQIQSLKDSFEQGDGENVVISDPHVTADLLKTYFRELSDALIPSSYYESFTSVGDLNPSGPGAAGSPNPSVSPESLNNHEITIERLKNLIEKIPLENNIVLNYLIHFLTLVAAESDSNKMNAKNLALVFGPNLVRTPNQNKIIDANALAKQMKRGEEVVYLMITNYSKLFPQGPPKPFQTSRRSSQGGSGPSTGSNVTTGNSSSEQAAGLSGGLYSLNENEPHEEFTINTTEA